MLCITNVMEDSTRVELCHSRRNLLFPHCLLTGYSALFRHPNDELNLCVYIIPGNPKVKDSDLPYWHNKMIKEDPSISRALGKSAKMERMRVGKATVVWRCV